MEWLSKINLHKAARFGRFKKKIRTFVYRFLGILIEYAVRMLNSNSTVKIKILFLIRQTNFFRMAQIFRAESLKSNSLGSNIEQPFYILGNELMSKNEWYRKFFSQGYSFDEKVENSDHGHLHSEGLSARTNRPSISVLISLYQADNHLSNLFSGLKNQTFFNEAEFIFILVSPSPKTISEIDNFSKQCSFFQKLEFDERIGIYDAWNRGIEISKSPYLTNWNADDNRQENSLEIQYNILDLYRWVDVVYQDVYYSFEPNLPWHVIKEIGMKSNLHNVSARYLLETGMNPPHNAPAWRKELHSKHGLFDDSYASAGDYEFWVRIALNNAAFFKASNTFAAYYLNPEGLSTKPGGPGLQETLQIRNKYLPVLNKLQENIINVNEIPSLFRSGKSADEISRNFILQFLGTSELRHNDQDR